MKSFFTKKLTIVLSLAVALVFVSFHTAHAADIIGNIFGFKAIDTFFFTILNWLSYAWLTLASWFLSATGMLLNVSLWMTINIKDFLQHMNGVYEVWTAIRDLSGTLIIFFVLWAAFQIILGLENPGIGNLLKNIIIAGVLINFSFFLVGFFVDISNIVSAQIYRQMVPERVANIKITTNGSTQSGQGIVSDIVRQSYGTGGIADIFMSAFNTNQLYSNNGQFKGDGQQNPLAIRMFIMQTTGAAAMFVAGFSFLFASLAFLIRLGVILFILAFSPIFFAAYMIPELNSYAKKGMDLFKAQLFFMPVYLLLMYMALKVVATGDFTGAGVVLNNGSTDKDFWLSLIGMVSNFFFVIVLLMIPLIGAVSMGGMSTKLANSWANAIKKRSIGALKSVGGTAWTNTGGRVASRVARSKGFQSLASDNLFGAIALKGTRAIGGGFDKRFEEQVKKRKEFAQSLDRDKSFKSRNATYLGTSIKARTTMFGNIFGRANRIASVQILRDRKKEIDKEIREKQNEINTIDNATIKATPARNPTPQETSIRAKLNDDILNDLMPERQQVETLLSSVTVGEGELNRRKY